MDGPGCVAFLSKWLSDNKVNIDKQMGVGTGNKYLAGILFTTSIFKNIVPLLQNVIQSDGCHVNFGKYTIYSAYGSTVDGTMFPISFAILFGNETKVGWGTFWEFTIHHYPCLNHPDITIITDQDKGSIAAIREHVPNTHHFHCFWHWKGNVLKNCQGGEKVNGGWWFFNQLVNCKNSEEMNKCHEENEVNVPAYALQYLARVNDNGQYPGACCDMGQDVFMYRRSASLGNESMNCANKQARERHGVDVVVATMLILIQLECNRFAVKKQWLGM